ncbi:ComEA family DNA-binding protein [Anaeromyxobacter paludicola]|uniref:Helix-hairpin-helix DNA-binding motif class 1 domain-containing protein n=1 Tax=Anaeromyxobacter paludicola TaxID=2918171 RepID=A0ABM7XEZ1_9BACT|nr:helix-hairpin-helix domain-containing protein [Anaeromyxobacter paludicola]BDG10457.1 hypothetical protein AMPC_35700 [Anaeromyxobacter paludicola]
MSRLATAALAAALLLPAAPALAAKKPLAPGERIDLNRASAAQLMRLPGVGRKKAEAIVAYRQQHPFQAAEQVTRVKGVSPGWFAKVRAHLSAAEPPASRAAGPKVAHAKGPGAHLPPRSPRGAADRRP